MPEIKENRFRNSTDRQFIEYGALCAVFDMYPESQVGLVAPDAQYAVQLAKEWLAKIVGTKRMFAILPKRPSRITNKSHEELIKHFEETGHSQHSPNATMLQYIIDYCEEKKIAYRITCMPGAGYFIEKAPEVQKILDDTVSRLKTHVKGLEGIEFDGPEETA